MYDAFEKDIAVVNIFFGKPTAIGRGYILMDQTKIVKCYRVPNYSEIDND